MKATFISREKNDVKFTMEFTAEEFEDAQIKAYQKTKDKYDVDGFRKGKAPRTIIERKYGEGIFFEDAIDELFAENYSKALDELKLEVVDTPSAEFGKIEKGQPLTVTLTVACFPEVEVKDYKGVEIEKIEKKILAADVNKELESLRKRNARQVNVDREAKEGDTLSLDYAGFVGEEQFEGGTAENQKLTLGSKTFIPGFEEQLIGVKAGESKDVTVTFPEEYHAPELAGKEAVFKCTVHQVMEEQLPELDDEFAQDVSEFDTLDELKKNTKKKLTEEAKQTCETQMKDAAVEAAFNANAEIEIPEVMVDDEIDRMAGEINQQLSYQGLSLEQYLKMMQSNMEDFKTQMRPDAEKSVKLKVILTAIAKAEKIEAEDSDVDAEFKRMAAMYGMEEDKIKEAVGEENVAYLKKDIVLKKTMDFIYDNAKITAAKKEEKETK